MPVKSGAVRVSVDVRSRVFQTVLAASLLLLVLLLVALVAIRNQADARGWVKHTDDVRLANARLLTTVVDAETSQRGYLVSGDRRLLARYLRAVDGWRSETERLRTLTRDNTTQQRRLDQLDTLLAERFASLARLLVAREAGASGASLAGDMLDDKEKMDRLRALLGDFDEEEARLGASRERDLRERSRALSLVVLSCIGGIALCVGLLLWQRRSSELRRQRLEETSLLMSELEMAHAELDSLFASAPMGFVLFDRQIRYRRLNNVLAAINGLSIEEHLGKRISEVLPDLPPELEASFERICTTGEALVNYEVEGETPAQPGELRTWRSSFFPIRRQDATITGVGGVIADVTAEVTARRQRLVLDDRYRCLVEATADIVWTNDSAGKMCGAQPGWSAFTGQSLEEYQGYGWSSCIHPEDRCGTVTAWEAAVAAQSMFTFEHRVRRHDGSYRWFSVRAVPVREASGSLREWVGLHRDIDAERSLQNQIGIERTKLRALIDQMPVAIVLHEGPELRYDFSNAAHDALVPGRTFMQRPLLEAFPELRGQRAADANFDCYRTGERRELVDEPLVLSDGSGVAQPRFFNITYQAIRASDGTVTGVVSTSIEVTEQVLANRVLEANLHFCEQFIGILGHDLRNPLNAMLMGAHLLARTSTDEGVRTIVARILRSGDRITRMIDQILDLARSRLGSGIPIERRPVAVHDLVTNIVEELRLAYPTRTIDWRALRGCHGSFDQDRLAQVVSNLLGNAIEHGDLSSPVVVTLDAAPDGLELRVHNHGEPIPPQLLPVLFDPYRQGVRASKTQGLGLGLFISQQIVRSHGGTLSVYSSRVEGTSFVVHLPRGIAQERSASARSELGWQDEA